MPEISVILVSYNSAAVIGAALRCVAGHPRVARVTVVDNASTDATVETVKQFPGVEIVQSSRNVGFGRGNNLGLANVTTPFALLLNPDAVLQEGALEALLDAAAHFPDAYILAPQLEDERGEVTPTIKRAVFNREQASGAFVPPEGPCCAPFVSGAVWLVRCAALRPGGFFDPNIFLYYEDDDLCLRARELGGTCVLVPGARAMHGMGKSSALGADGTAFRHLHMAWSRLYLEQKYRGAGAAVKLGARQLRRAACKQALYTLLCRRRKRQKYAAQCEGIRCFLKAPSNPAPR